MRIINTLIILLVISVAGVLVIAAIHQQYAMTGKHAAEYDQGTYVTDAYRLHTVEHDGRMFAVCVGYSSVAMVELK